VPVCGTIRFVGILPPSCVSSEFALALRWVVRSERNESAIRIAPNVPIMKGKISRNGYGGGYSGMSSAQFFVDGPGGQRLAVRSALFILCCPLFPSATGLCRWIDGWREGRQRIRKETGRTCAVYQLVEPAGITPLLSRWLYVKRAYRQRKPRSLGLNTLVCLEYLF
jgi:hypothetical protein